MTGITTVGFAAGESTAKPLFQLSGGVSIDRWFAGAGFGMDDYYFNSFPLFADWRMGFGKKRLLFVYADGGYTFPGKYGGNNDFNFFKTTDRLLGGFYMDTGFGYRIRLNSLHRILLSAGYSQKNLTKKIGYTFPCGIEPCLEQVDKYHYQLGRIVTKLSWEFGKTK